MMTRHYGTWVTVFDGRNSVDPEHSVADALGSYGSDYDIPGLIDHYRRAINAALPNTVWLCGDEFIGPVDDSAGWEDYPVTEEGHLDIATIVESVDFYEIAELYDTKGE